MPDYRSDARAGKQSRAEPQFGARVRLHEAWPAVSRPTARVVRLTAAAAIIPHVASVDASPPQRRASHARRTSWHRPRHPSACRRRAVAAGRHRHPARSALLGPQRRRRAAARRDRRPAGAAALGDIGELFPDTDPANRGPRFGRNAAAGASSKYTRPAYRIVNLDCIVFAERPKLSPYKESDSPPDRRTAGDARRSASASRPRPAKASMPSDARKPSWPNASCCWRCVDPLTRGTASGLPAGHFPTSSTEPPGDTINPQAATQQPLDARRLVAGESGPRVDSRLQHAVEDQRALRTGHAGQGRHLSLRAHGLQAQPHRPHGRAGDLRRRQALSDLLRLPGHAGDQHHRRRRQADQRIASPRHDRWPPWPKR